MVSVMASCPTLEGQVLVVIGGTTGLGLSAALALRRAGAHLAIVGRSAESAAQARDQLGQGAEVLTGDARQPATAEKTIAAAISRWGRLDGLYHVAGGSGRAAGDGPLHELTDQGLAFTLDLNLHSLIYSNRAALRTFLSQRSGGVILNLSSVLGTHPEPRHFATHAYAAAKSAVTGLTRSLAAYYAPHGIRANVICPALVDTPMAQRAVGSETIRAFIRTKQPLEGGRLGLAGDLDAAVVFLLSDGSRYITGQEIAVDGGWSVSQGQYATERPHSIDSISS